MATTRLGRLAVALVALATFAAAVGADTPAAGGRADAGAGDGPHSRVGRLDVAGGSLAGELVPVPEVDGGTRDTFLWKSPRFAAPIEFRLGEVAGITYGGAAVPVEPAGPRVQLRGGDVLAATVVGLDADALVVAADGPDGPQRLRIARDEVVAVVLGGEGGGAYRGPTGLDGWTQEPAGAWREEAGRISTDKAGAAVTRDVGAPVRARYAIRLSRRRAAEFRVCVAAAERPADDGYVLQAVGNEPTGGLMLIRRVAGREGARAQIEPLPAAPWRGDVLRVVLFVDQERGRFAVLLPDAEGADARKVFEATLSDPEGTRPSGRFRLELNGGDICLERLEVTPWRGDAPTIREAAETTILTRDGGLEGFSVSAFDAATGAYVLQRGTETRRLTAAEITEIRFPDGGDEAGEADEAALRVVRTDGSVLSGALVKADDRSVWLRRRGIDKPVALGRDSIAAIRSQRPTPRPEEPAGRVGTLVVGEDRVRGWLVGGGADAPGGIAWRPVGSVAAVPLAGEPPDAVIEYVSRRADEDRKGGRRANNAEVGGIGGLVNRDDAGFFIVAMMTEEGAAARDGRIQPGDRIIAVAPTETSRFVETKGLDNETVTLLLRGRIGTTVRLKVTDGAGANPRDIDLARGPINAAGDDLLRQALEAHVRLAGAGPQPGRGGEFPARVVLRSGDVAPCRIDAVDAEAVVLRSPLAGGPDSGPVRVPVALVKAIDMIPSDTNPRLDKTLFTRLLTLPRMQRDRPPTHLLRLVGGDYLRGRLVSVDDAIVMFEVLDAVKRLPREQVARLIWLHPDVPGAEDDAAAEPLPEEPGLVVQEVAADGRRFTLVAEDVAGNQLRGRSQAFGESSIDLTRIDRLLVGAAIGRERSEMPFAQWKLKPAAEPRAAPAPDGK